MFLIFIAEPQPIFAKQNAGTQASRLPYSRAKCDFLQKKLTLPSRSLTLLPLLQESTTFAGRGLLENAIPLYNIYRLKEFL